jgi:ATP-dependent Clp protease protease subunit
MPLKLPKIPLMADPEDEIEAEDENEEEEEVQIHWIKLHTILYESGVLFLTEDITRKSGNTIIGLIMHLALHNPTQDMYLFINCVAGPARMAVAIFDAIQTVTPDVNTVGCGMTAAVGSLILLAGDMRLGYPHVRVLIHKPKPKRYNFKKGTLRGFFHKQEIATYIDNVIDDIFVARTGQPYDVIAEDLEHKRCMSAKEAQDYGIIDVITSEFNFDLL